MSDDTYRSGCNCVFRGQTANACGTYSKLESGTCICECHQARTEVHTEPRIVIPDMCQKHQALLVFQVGVPESGPWRSLIVMAQIALFQGATADPVLFHRVDGDLGRLGEIGCLACFKPDCFGEIVEAAKLNEPGAIKRLGESWAKHAAV